MALGVAKGTAERGDLADTLMGLPGVLRAPPSLAEYRVTLTKCCTGDGHTGASRFCTPGAGAGVVLSAWSREVAEGETGAR